MPPRPKAPRTTLLPEVCDGSPEGLVTSQRGKNKKAITSRRPITAMIRWEERFRGKLNWGEVLMLMADGTVWACACFRSKDGGTVGYSEGKKKQTLEGLKKDHGKDVRTMARIWRYMVANRETGFEMVGELVLDEMAFD